MLDKSQPFSSQFDPSGDWEMRPSTTKSSSCKPSQHPWEQIHAAFTTWQKRGQFGYHLNAYNFPVYWYDIRSLVWYHLNHISKNGTISYIHIQNSYGIYPNLPEIDTIGIATQWPPTSRYLCSSAEGTDNVSIAGSIGEGPESGAVSLGLKDFLTSIIIIYQYIYIFIYTHQ